eukprot:CAMPEP_0174953240 /NCGR_PEP_ID=MMETSP1355-20121228/95772_1 /TAXON_ID=464990 /ORGANISM="Hemiselmis tepida, Strain CCMP443" /LENGTH=771 /DNA_ID=CAMNT_0016200945 /DNA_START=81 /DNA_END=2396 /DNA_ORIENTATION=+
MPPSGDLLRRAGGAAAAAVVGNGTNATNHSSDHGCGDHHDHWWRDDSELAFANGIALMIMIVVVVIFEHSHHWFHKYCEHRDKRRLNSVQEEAEEVDEEQRQIRHFLTRHSSVFKGSHMSAVLDRFTDELMVLGFIAFVVWVFRKAGGFHDGLVNKNYGPPDGTAMLHVVEDTHMALFINMCLYFIILFFSIQHVEFVSEQYGRFEKIIQQENTNGQIVTPKHRTGCFVSTVFESEREYFSRMLDEYRNMRQFFVQWIVDHDIIELGVHGAETDVLKKQVMEGFDFACYLRMGIEAYIMDMIAVHTSTWMILFILDGTDVLISYYRDRLGDRTSVGYVMIGMSFGYLIFGYMIKAVISHRFRSKNLSDSGTIITFVSKVIPDWGEILVLRFFQAMVMFCSFTIADFVSKAESYNLTIVKSGIPLWGHWILRITYWIIMGVMFRGIVVSLNQLLRLPPFIDDRERGIVQAIFFAQTEGCVSMMEKAVRARARGDDEAAEQWTDEVEKEGARKFIQAIKTGTSFKGMQIDAMQLASLRHAAPGDGMGGVAFSDDSMVGSAGLNMLDNAGRLGLQAVVKARRTSLRSNSGDQQQAVNSDGGFDRTQSGFSPALSSKQRGGGLGWRRRGGGKSMWDVARGAARDGLLNSTDRGGANGTNSMEVESSIAVPAHDPSNEGPTRAAFLAEQTSHSHHVLRVPPAHMHDFGPAYPVSSLLGRPNLEGYGQALPMGHGDAAQVSVAPENVLVPVGQPTSRDTNLAHVKLSWFEDSMGETA